MNETDDIKTDDPCDIDFTFCFRCGHVWTPKTDTEPKRCPRCHSSRWNVPVTKERACKFCGSVWRSNDANADCPSCGRSQMDGLTPRSLHCNQCDYDWLQHRSDPPLKCPLCRSTKWNEPKGNREVCLRCRHIWNNRSESPKKCPKCHSSLWNVPPIASKCQRCGHEWRGRKDSDKASICPSCKSKKWMESPNIRTCNICGKTYIARSGKIVNGCPSCNPSRSVMIQCKVCGKKWSGKANTDRCPRCYVEMYKRDIINSTYADLWTDGVYQLRYLSEDRFGSVYLWEGDLPLAAMYFHEFCRRFNATAEHIIDAMNNGSMQEEMGTLAKEMLDEKDRYKERTGYFMKRLNLSETDANVLSIHFTGMGPRYIALRFGMSKEEIRESFDRIMEAYIDSGIIVDDTVFTENPFAFY